MSAKRLPVIAIAVATPLAAASTVDVGAFSLDGSCGVLGPASACGPVRPRRFRSV
jgi:hypothetical protein